MNRFALFFFFCMLILQNLFCQKHDYNWIVGYDSSDPPIGWWGVSQIDFGKDSMQILYISESPIYMNWDGNTMSNQDGSLIYYSNGCYILNTDHQIMENGDGLNPGNVNDTWCAAERGYPIMQGSLNLPIPNSDNKYCMFHLSAQKTSADLKIFCNKLYFTEINMAANNGRGKVTDKNHLLLEDTLCYGQLTAVRHGNGRDWWIIMPESSSNRYYKFLLTPQGISGPFTQSLGKVWDFKDWSGQAHFTPNGTQYLRYDTYNNLNIYDFDRCTGQLSNHRYVDVGFNSDTVVAGGLAISPNSRFAYVTTDWYVWQFDLWASDIKASQILVASIDWFQSPPGFYTFFYAAQLAPDGKIYINSSSSTDYMHIIHHPNELGLACDLEQHGLKLAGLNAFTMPYFPNYRQYDVPGSVCDTLGIDAPPMAGTHSEIVDTQVLSIFPNPAQNTLWINLPTERSATISLITLTGSVVREYSCAGGETQLSLSDLPNGIYLCRIQTQEGVLRTEKIVVQR